MELKKILKLLIFFLFWTVLACSCSFAETDIEAKQRETREQINRLKWLETVETNKLYKNQQKLENATTSLSTSKTKIQSAERELIELQTKLDVASREYNSLNYVLATHIRSVFKSQRKAFFEILLNSEDINMLVDRVHFQKIILKEDYDKMAVARRKAQEIANLKYNSCHYAGAASDPQFCSLSRRLGTYGDFQFCPCHVQLQIRRTQACCLDLSARL